MESERFVGIDVAKGWLDVVARPDGATWRVANDPDGWAELCARFAAAPPTLIVVEASGGYELGLVTALDLVGLTPVVANPLSIRRFAQSLGKRAKTDRLDAAVLAEYGERVRPEPRPVPTETARQLQEVIARHRQLTKMLVEEKNRRQQVTALVLPSVDAHIAWLEQQRAEVDRLLESVVARDPTWQERVRVLDSVPGIGALTATILAVGMPELGACSGSAAAALLGVVRHAFYEAVMSTVRWDPVIGTHYRQLRDAGKPHKVALIACMRRLLGILNAMLRGGLTWQETDVGQGRFLTQPLDS